MAEIKADLSQYYSMKAVLEQILGKGSFMKVKDYGSLSSWRAEAVRLLKTINYSIDVTVEIADEDWRTEIRTEIRHGISMIRSASAIDELFSNFSAVLVKIVFLQIGFLPLGHRSLRYTPPLIPQNWKLDPVRSVQYVQSKKQRLTQKRIKEAREQSSKNTQQGQ